MAKAMWPSQIVTAPEVRQILAELETLKSWLADYNRSVRIGAITKSPKPVLSTQSQLFTGKVEPAKLTPDRVAKLIEDTEKALSGAAIVHVALSVLPTPDVRQDIGNWFRNNISPNILLEFTTDTSLGGGMVVRTKNHLYNFSLSRLLWEKRQLIPRLVHGL